jgi:hypothetical protein
VQVRFHNVADAELCQVDVAAASKPVVVTLKDKNGQTVQKFYARSGNLSQEISMAEMNAYVKDRFP